MKKRFNITGVCYPHLHYMMDVSKKMEQIVEMVESGDYFVINRPRQYGKTTTLYLLTELLKKAADYIPIRLNFQGINKKVYETEYLFVEMLIHQISDYLEFIHPDLASFVKEQTEQINDMSDLSRLITKLVHKTDKNLVLLIDEVDIGINHSSFISFLGMLRTKFLDRYSMHHATFQSVVLAGVHDIKTLKQKIRSDEGGKYQSPWNIAADFKVRMSFSAAEIVPMLEDYAQAEEVEIDAFAIAEKLHYYTTGYPFLVSKLCKIITEDLLSQKTSRSWEVADLEKAVQLLIRENNTNFDTLIKNLENHPELYDLAYRVIVEGETIPFNPHEPTINLGRLYGIFKFNGTLKVHNRIYEQSIYNYMVAKTIVKFSKVQNYSGQFLLPNNELDLEAVLLKFQQVMKEQYSLKTEDFLEHQGRLVFLAFLAPILNGQGYTFKEVQVSIEKRLDVVITYFQHRYIIELKRWYGAKAHEQGLDQLADYLDIHNLRNGYLLIFDPRKDKTWASESITHKGKNIFAIWV